MNNSKRLWMLAGLLAVSAVTPMESSANSKFLNVQGMLTDSNGSPLTGTQTVTFRLYTSSTASIGSAVWNESDSVSLSSGIFNLTLGSTTALDPLSFSQLYYLGIQVAGDSNELSPRQPLGASAYAQGSLGNFNVGNNLLVGSSITASSVGIGTANPTYRLDVYGDVHSTGTFYGNGSGISGVALIIASQSFTGSDSFLGTNSTFTVQNSEILLGTSTTPGVYSEVVNPSGAITVKSSSTFLAIGQATYSITTSSGIYAGGGTSVFATTATQESGQSSGQFLGSVVGAGFQNYYDITATGSGNWTVPAGVTKIMVYLVGGGGSGGGGKSAGAGGGGGSGCFDIFYSTTTPGDSTSYFVGSGGATTSAGGAGNNGTATTFKIPESAVAESAGYGTGATGNGNSTGGGGGSCAGVGIKFSGSAGGLGGVNGSWGGTGAPGIFGMGAGQPGSTNGVAGSPNTGAGGGGGGTATTTGGAGGSGRITIFW